MKTYAFLYNDKDEKNKANVYSEVINFQAFNKKENIGEIIGINENLPQPVFEPD